MEHNSYYFSTIARVGRCFAITIAPKLSQPALTVTIIAKVTLIASFIAKKDIVTLITSVTAVEMLSRDGVTKVPACYGNLYKQNLLAQKAAP